MSCFLLWLNRRKQKQIPSRPRLHCLTDWSVLKHHPMGAATEGGASMKSYKALHVVLYAYDINNERNTIKTVGGTYSHVCAHVCLHMTVCLEVCQEGEVSLWQPGE